MKRIFIVDDDVSILEVLQIVLQEEGYEVITDTGYQAMAIVDEYKPDLLLLDIWMRGIDGREIARQIKSHPSLASMPIILMSAHSHSDSVLEEAQADAFIEKPFDIGSMLRVVKQYV